MFSTGRGNTKQISHAIFSLLILAYKIKRVGGFLVATFTDDQRTRGFEQLQSRMASDPAARVRQKLKGGRPRRVVNEQIPVLDAVARLTKEVETGRRHMAEAGLNPDDIGAGLVFTVPESGEFGCKWLPAGPMGDYVSELDRLATRGTLLFLGVLWRQKHTDGTALWVLPYMGGEAAKKQLQAVLSFAASAAN
jgi:hypothetical protein